MNERETPGVLLVDPDVGERGRVKRELESRGWNVWEAADETTAMRVYSESQVEIQAAVVDLQLPGFQGGRVLTELAEIAPSLTRLAMSADVSPYTAAAFRQLTQTLLFAKPVRVRDLDATLRELTTATP